MFIQFNFKNYKSFKEDTSIDMTATSIKDHPYNLIELENHENYLKVAAVYGANASGKSNLVEAFLFMKYLVINSLALETMDIKVQNNPIPIKNFLFDNSSKNSPSEFEIFFLHNNLEYQYGFVIDKDKIHEEWLYRRKLKSKKTDILFERMDNQIEFGKNMKDAEKFKDSTEDKTLFLTLTAKTKVEESKVVYQWFQYCNVMDFGDSFFESIFSGVYSNELLQNDIYKKKMEDFLIAIDTGIKGIKIREIKSNNDTESNPDVEIYSLHENIETGEIIEMPFAHESSGTKKMFFLFDYFMQALEKGSLLVIDELNAKLHPLLLRYIINMFHDASINKKNAQLIFTTHDMYTLTKDIFRRDEVWFTEKDSCGASKLYSLVEYKLDDNSKVRNDATFNKDYVSGRYGAIPLLKEFSLMED